MSNYLGPVLERSAAIYRARLRAEFPKLTITQIMALESLADGNAHSQRDMTRLTGIDRATLNVLVRRLVAAGYAKSMQSEKKRSASAVSLTGAGRNALRDAHTAMHRIERDILRITRVSLMPTLAATMRTIVERERPKRKPRYATERENNMHNALEAMEG